MAARAPAAERDSERLLEGGPALDAEAEALDAEAEAATAGARTLSCAQRRLLPLPRLAKPLVLCAGLPALALLALSLVQGRRRSSQAAASDAGAPSEGHQEVGLVGVAGPSLFCWSVMKPHSDEETLIKFQLKRRTSIFNCNDFAVISSARVNLGPGDFGDVHTWYNPAATVTVGQLGGDVTTNSFLNTNIFIVAWNTLVSSGKMAPHDFVAKADPDCVFFPDRLRTHVEPHLGQNVYFPNCNLFLDAPPQGPKLYGALEVFSKQAMEAYANGNRRCENELNWHGWGEDYYIQSCMILLGAQGVGDFNMVGDNRCSGAPCTDYTRVSFHPYKSLAEYKSCFTAAISR